MKTKVEIKSTYGSLLFEFEKENNTVKDTVIEAAKSGANLTGAYLTGANDEKIKIKKASVFTGLYTYTVIPFISEDDIKYVKMGCFTRKLSDWESDFWNNDNEFPNDNSEKSNLRLFAFETAKRWFETVK